MHSTRNALLVVLAVREYSQEGKGPAEIGPAEYYKVRLQSFVRALRRHS